MIINFPKAKKPEAQLFTLAQTKSHKFPLFASPVFAGAPTLSEDFMEGKIDLNTHLVKHPEKTFVVKVTGDSMVEARIFPDDLLLVESRVEAKEGDIVVAAINGELTVKRLCYINEQPYLMPENSGYAGIEVTNDMNFHLWGVVTNVIHRL